MPRVICVIDGEYAIWLTWRVTLLAVGKECQHATTNLPSFTRSVRDLCAWTGSLPNPLILHLPPTPESEHETSVKPIASTTRPPVLVNGKLLLNPKRRYNCTFDGCDKSHTKHSCLEEHERSHTGDVRRINFASFRVVTLTIFAMGARSFALRAIGLFFAKQAHTRSHLPKSDRPYMRRLRLRQAILDGATPQASGLRAHKDDIHFGENPFKAMHSRVPHKPRAHSNRTRPPFSCPEEPDVPPPPPSTIILNIGGPKPPISGGTRKSAPPSSSSALTQTPGTASPAPGYKTFTIGREKTDTTTVTQEVSDDLFGDIKEHLNIVFIGLAETWKSTKGGNILFLSGTVEKRTMEKYECEAKEAGRETWYLSWTKARRYTILDDAPGHKTFLPSMISGAAQTHVALLDISACKGELETGSWASQHIMLVKTAGVNKMDDPTVRSDMARYEEIKEKLAPFVQAPGSTSRRTFLRYPYPHIRGPISRTVSRSRSVRGVTVLPFLFIGIEVNKISSGAQQYTIPNHASL
ncbi:hypothetical protein EI94DRAFT_1804012 [Lactarius quietus]|nr:hypothetical protein EI94DRAFT_1804012 [Lactarius quietus]